MRKAVASRDYRSDRVRERIQEEIHRGTILIDTLGAKVGEIGFSIRSGLDTFLAGTNNVGVLDTLAAAEPSVYLGPVPYSVVDDRVRLRIGPAHSAYLRISEGCDHRCSFCTIPSIRGRFRSKPQELVLAEAKEAIGISKL